MRKATTASPRATGRRARGAGAGRRARSARGVGPVGSGVRSISILWMADRSHARRNPRAWLPGIAIALAIGLCYGPFLDRGFTSEDFLLIRFLAEHPPWQGFWTALGEPWLGISGILFIRPISTLLYGIEIAAFGAVPFAYNLVHLLVHVGNALLVASTARALGLERAAALGAGLLFGLYPLHPNAVLFTASFATLIGGAFVLGSFRLYLWSSATGRRAPWIAAMVAFVLALGSYETSIVLPLWLAAHEVLTARDRRWRRSLVSLLPFGLLVGAVLGVPAPRAGLDAGRLRGSRPGDPAARLAELDAGSGHVHRSTPRADLRTAAVQAGSRSGSPPGRRRPGDLARAAGAASWVGCQRLADLAPRRARHGVEHGAVRVPPGGSRQWPLLVSGRRRRGTCFGRARPERGTGARPADHSVALLRCARGRFGLAARRLSGNLPRRCADRR